MATYAKGFKKQASEWILLKIIVGIIGAVLLIVLAAFLYDLSVSVGSYDDYTHIANYDEILAQVDADSEPLQDYIIYFYSDECLSCSAIQKDALRLVARINNDETVVFFVNTAEVAEATTGDRDVFLGAINESSLRTPMLVVVNNGDFEEVAVGSDAVLALLQSVKTGDYTPFN